ncbi:MAG: hypothetical protein ISR75_03490 [Phycisphaerales bacterium]|nr:hypothetical protein [Planctomycetota bacterium]MBL6997485.1 hypothetical protein [Phycisphaerales bacterium]
MKYLAFLIVTTSTVFAQWSDTSDVDAPICIAGGDQAITKIVAEESGGCYVSWFDNRSGGYDVYMQRLDASGNALWQTDGILIADRNYSSTMDFDMDIDSAGNAVVVYRKNVLGGDGIVVTSVSPKGTIRWNTTVQSSGSFVASPVITASNDDVVVGWIKDNVSDFHRLNVAGELLWALPQSIDDPAGGTLFVADIQPSLNGGVIASFVQYTTYWGNKQLKAVLLDVDGINVWDEMVSVMVDNSLQYGAYPDFISDGEGGGFFTWYGVNPLQCYANRVSANGTIWGAGQVQVASSLGATQRVDPIAVRDGSEFVVFFRSQDNSQNDDGIGAQLFSGNGGLLWGNGGVTLKPTTSTPQYGSFAAAKTDVGVALFYDESASFGDDVVEGIGIDVSGLLQWEASVASTPSSKSRMVASTTGDGILLAWQDDRSGSNDIFGKRVNSDGSLGNNGSCEGDIDGDGTVGVTDILSAIGAWGACANCPADLDDDGFVGVTDLLAIIGQWGSC